MIERLSVRNLEYAKETLLFSEEQIALLIGSGEIKEGFFTITGPAGRLTEGYIHTSDRRMECVTKYFTGSEEQIFYQFHGTFADEGDVIAGSFFVVSNQGEYELPFLVRVRENELVAENAIITNLFLFANLARENWREAVRCFYDPAFAGLLTGQEERFIIAYRGLSAVPGNEQNVEEFLQLTGKKQRIEYLLDKTQITLEDSRGKNKNEITITRNGWGCTCLHPEAEGDFLALSENTLREEDFQANICRLPFVIKSEALHSGNNFGKIIIRTAYEVMEVEVTVIRNPERRIIARHKAEISRLVFRLMNAYQDFRMKKLGMGKWLSETEKVLGKLTALDDRNVVYRLFQAHVFITQEKYSEAKWLLDHYEKKVLEEEAAIRCYYLYLTTLYNRDEDYVDEVTRRVKEIFQCRSTDWRIAWLLLYLSEEINRSLTGKWVFLENQFTHGCTSPVLYIEAIQLVNANPTLLMKLGSYEKQVLMYGAKKGILRDEVTGHLQYLAGREKKFSKSLLRILELCYHNKQEPGMLQTICALLVKGNQTDPAYYPYYRQGVEQEFRITRLYEYFMMSVDLTKEVEIPKMVMMYFAYQSNLDYQRNAYLYAYLFRNREEYPELFLAYRSQIERFVIRQLYKGRINRNLAFLYSQVLDEQMLTRDNANELAGLLFINELKTEKKDIIRVVTVHKKLKKETISPLTAGMGHVSVYGREYEILLEDAAGNRFVAGQPYELHRLLPEQAAAGMEDSVESRPGFDLYICERGRNSKNIYAANVARFRYLAESEEVCDEYRKELRYRLLRYYFEKDKMRELDSLLEQLEPAGISTANRKETIRCLVVRGMYDKANAWVKQWGPAGVDPKILLRLCSRLLDRDGMLTGEEMTWMAFEAFQGGSYDSNLLRCLVLYYEGSTKRLEQIFEAAKNFDVDTYEICEKLLVQSMVTGYGLRREEEIFRIYQRGGGRSEVETALITGRAHQYIVQDREPAPFVMQGITGISRRRETLSDVCRLAYLRYYAAHKEEILRSTSGEFDVRTNLSIFGQELLQNGIYMPFFASLADCIPCMEQFADKTMILYKGRQGQGMEIHYRFLQNEDTQAPFVSAQMPDMYGGIFVKTFILFVGERLEYYITGTGGNKEEALAGGTEIKADNAKREEGRYDRLNRIEALSMLGEDGCEELIEEYRRMDFMVNRLFQPLQDS